MSKRILAVAAVALSFAACASDSVVSPGDPIDEGSLTVDASATWQFVSLAEGATVNPTPSAAASTAWDIAFLGTNVTLNGGDAGPGGVSAACLCQNASATNEQILAMTPANQFQAFDTVSAVPAGLVFSSDVLTPAIKDWFSGSGASATADTTKVWLLRLADSTSFAAIRVKGISGAAATHAGDVTFEYRLQPTAGSELGPIETITVNAGTPAHAKIDFNAQSTTDDEANWDIRVDGFTIRVNGGISGIGKGGAATETIALADLTTAETFPSAYVIDTYSGVFGAQRYYRYNLLGDHGISPTYDVYFIRRGADTYKLQVIGYYGPTGTSRQITIRWAKLD